MSAIIINADSQSLKLLKALAEKLGAKVTNLNKTQMEVLALGNLMEHSKTGEYVSRETIFKQLDKK